eukprot:766241-Rhodomonas_salina.1
MGSESLRMILNETLGGVGGGFGSGVGGGEKSVGGGEKSGSGGAVSQFVVVDGDGVGADDSALFFACVYCPA